MRYRQSYHPEPPPSRPRLPVEPRFAIIGGIALLVVIALLFAFLRGGDDVEGADEADAPSNVTGAVVVESPTEVLPDPATLVTTPAPLPAPTSLGLPLPEVSAGAFIVVDDASLAVLAERDGYMRRAPASLTKVATAIVTAEQARLDDEAVSPVHYWELEDSSTMALEPGDVLTLRELLYGLMLVSGNDAAIAIAEHVSGTEAAFVSEMNRLVERLGLEDTHFENTEGLSSPGHYSSAWDLAILARYLMRFPDLREIVGTEEYTATGIRNGEPIEFDLYNHNPLLNYTPGVDGVKTGFTEEAGRTFALTAERDGRRVYIVLLNTALRAQDSQALVEWAFDNHEWAAAAPDTPPTTP